MKNLGSLSLPPLGNLLILTFLLIPATVFAKTQPSVYTLQRQANARANAAEPWTERDSHLGYTQPWLGRSIAEVHELVIDPSIPRAHVPSMTGTCPNGKPLLRWFVDPDLNRFKVKCMDTDNSTPDLWYPENDFEAHYNRNRTSDGVYLYPPQDTTFCDPANPAHDCGYGAIINGRRYFFVAHYAYEVLKQIARLDLGDPIDGRSLIWSGALTALFQNPEVSMAAARRVAIALEAFADQFDDFAAYYQVHLSREPALRNYMDGPHGIFFGQMTDGVVLMNMIRAYDIIYLMLDDPELQAALRALHPERQAGLRTHLEERLFWPSAEKLKQGVVWGNSSLPHNLGLHFALVLDDGARSQELIDWVFAPGLGRLPELFFDSIDRDGGCDEVSATYCALGYSHHLGTGEIIDLFSEGELDLDGSYTIADAGRYTFRLSRYYRFARQLETIPGYYVHLGDECCTGNANMPPRPTVSQLTQAFDRFGPDRELAAQAVEANGGTLSGLHTTFWDADPYAVQGEIALYVPNGNYRPMNEENLAGYGFAQLKGGSGSAPHSVWSYFGRSNNAHGAFGRHGHHDALDFGIQQRGLDMMPTVGYPSNFGWRYFAWEANTASHNSILVDRTTQSRAIWSSDITSYLNALGSPVSVMELESTTAYPGAYEWPVQLPSARLRRMLIRVPLPRDNFYVLEVSTVNGGNTHHYSYHGGGPAILFGGLGFTNARSTYASVDSGGPVAFGAPYDFVQVDAACRASISCVEANSYLYRGSGFQFLRDAAVGGGVPDVFTADWLQIDWNTGAARPDLLRAYVLPVFGINHIASATGEMPGGEPVRYLMLRGQNGTTGSAVVNIWTPHGGKPFVQSVTPRVRSFSNGNLTIGLDIRLENGQVHHVGIDQAGTAPRVSGNLRWTGKVAIYAETRNRKNWTYLAEGSRLAWGTRTWLSGAPSITGTVQSVSESDGASSVVVNASVQQTLVNQNRWMDVQPLNPGDYRTRRDNTYRLRGVNGIQGGTRIDLGDVPLISGHRDRNNYDAGFALHINPGDRVRIPIDRWN